MRKLNRDIIEWLTNSDLYLFLGGKMPTSYGFSLNNSNVYKDRDVDASKKGTGKGDHAEVKVYNMLKTKHTAPFLIMQDAFPCTVCHAKFLAFSKTHSIIIRAVAPGGYGNDHPGQIAPLTIYYNAGVAKYNDPTNFPGIVALPADYTASSFK